jgi:hypothetical protein
MRYLYNARPELNWKDEIDWSSATWELVQGDNIIHRGSGGSFSVPRNRVGSFTLRVNATEAINIIYTYEVDSERIVRGTDDAMVRYSTMSIRINVLESPFAHLRPVDEVNFYNLFGFDNARTPFEGGTRGRVKQDIYGEPLERDNIRRYTPFLFKEQGRPTPVNLILEYFPFPPMNLAHIDRIILRSGNDNLTINGDSEYETAPNHLIGGLNVAIRSRSELYDRIRVFSRDRQGYETLIGNLDVRSHQRNPRINTRTIRIISVTQSGTRIDRAEKERMVNEINRYFRNQALIEFVLDTGAYTDYLDHTDYSGLLGADGRVCIFAVRSVYQAETGIRLNDIEHIYHLFVFDVRPLTPLNLPVRNGLAFRGGNVSLVFNQSLETAAHELGHNLGLKDVHDPEELGVSMRGGTRNLMDWPASQPRKYFLKHQIEIMNRINPTRRNRL